MLLAIDEKLVCDELVRDGSSGGWCMRARSRILVILFAVGLSVACAGPNEKANKLFIEATRMVESAQQSAITSYTEAAGRFQESLKRIDLIQSKYPSSNIAVEIAQDKVVLGSVTVSQLRALTQEMAEMAQAEASFLKCSAYLESKAAPSAEKAWDLALIASKYAEVGDLLNSMTVALEAHDMAVLRNDDTWTTPTLELVSTTYARVGRVNDALRVAREIGDSTYKDVQLRQIAEELSRKGNLNDAVAIIESIGSSSIKESALSSLAVASAEAKQFDLAIEVVAELSEEWHKQIVREALVSNLAREDDYSQAIAILDAVPRPADRAVLLSSLACGRAACRDKSAIDLLARAKQAADALDDTDRKASLLADIAAGYWDAGDAQLARDVFSQAAICVRQMPGSLSRAESFANIGSKAARVDSTKAADFVREALSTLRNPGKSLSGYDDDVYLPTYSVDALCRMARSPLSVGDTAAVSKVLEHAMRAAAGINAHDCRSKDFGLVIVYSCDVDPPSMVRKALANPDYGVYGAVAVALRELRGQALLEIAQTYAMAGQYDKALACMDGINYRHWKHRILASVGEIHDRSRKPLEDRSRSALHWIIAGAATAEAVSSR